MKPLKHLPNLLTLSNLFCGCLILFVLLTKPNNPTLLCILLFFCLLFDFLDGLVARTLNAYSEIGKQLDSLADLVSFGAVPGFMMFSLIDSIISKTIQSPIGLSNEVNSYLPFLGLLIVLFSAIRLAKFNIDTEQASYFKGLAVPANALLIFSLYYHSQLENQLYPFDLNLISLVVITLFSCFLLISNIPLFSFKFKSMSWKINDYKYIFLVVSVILLIVFWIPIIPVILFLYILNSLIFRKKILNEAIETD